MSSINSQNLLQQRIIMLEYLRIQSRGNIQTRNAIQQNSETLTMFLIIYLLRQQDKNIFYQQFNKNTEIAMYTNQIVSCSQNKGIVKQKLNGSYSVECNLTFASKNISEYQSQGANDMMVNVKNQQQKINTSQKYMSLFRSNTSGSLAIDECILRQKSSNMQHRKSQMIALELETNEGLRINLFKAQKTIGTLEELFTGLKDNILNKLQNSKKQTDEKLNTSETTPKLHKVTLTPKKYPQNQQNINPINTKHEQIIQIWKSCYKDLIKQIQKYTTDIELLIQQYQVLQAKHKDDKKKYTKSIKKEKSLMNILKQSTEKMQKTEQTIEKAIEDLNQRDRKIDEYQMENKNLKMKILGNLQQIDKLRRDNRLLIRDNATLRQIIQNMEQNMHKFENKFSTLNSQLENREKSQEIFKKSQKALKKQLETLEQQLNQTRTFNENVMEDYKNLTAQMNFSEQKLNEKCYIYEQSYQQKLKQYEKYIQNLKQEKQLIIQKNAQIVKEQIQQKYKKNAEMKKQNADLLSQLNNLQQKFCHIQKETKIIKQEIQQKDNTIEKNQQKQECHLIKMQKLEEQLQNMTEELFITVQIMKQKDRQISQLSQFIRDKFISADLQRKGQIQVRKIQQEQDSDVPMILNNNEQIVWKKMKKQSSVSVMDCANSNNVLSQHHLQKQKQLQESLEANFSNTMPELIFIRKQNELKPKMFFINQNQDSNFDPTFRQIVDTSKSKFSLSAFKNKLVFEENAKTLFQLNKTLQR